MASVTTITTKAGALRYRVKYRDPTGRQRYKTFRREKDARAFRATTENDMLRGDWIDPKAGRQTFAEVAEEWIVIADVKDSTRSGYRSVLDRHLLPHFGDMPIAGITTPEVERFLAAKREEPAYNRTGKPTSAETIRNIRNNLSAVMRYAERSGMIRSNPVTAVKAPKSKQARPEMMFLTAGQVTALVDAVGATVIADAASYARRSAEAAAKPGDRGAAKRAEHWTGELERRERVAAQYRLAVKLDAYTGLRAGELWALKVGRVDLMRRRITVAASITEVHGEQVEGTPKNHQTRTVPIPKFLVDELAEHLAPIADDADAYVFTAPRGGPVRHSTFYDRWFQPAAVAAGLGQFVDVKPAKPRKTPTGRVSKAKAPQRYEGLRFHDLRHTAVSFMIAAGASPLVISRTIGHGSISVTYDVYGHILPDHADDLADGLDAIHAAATDRAEGSVVPISRR